MIVFINEYTESLNDVCNFIEGLKEHLKIQFSEQKNMINRYFFLNTSNDEDYLRIYVKREMDFNFTGRNISITFINYPPDHKGSRSYYDASERAIYIDFRGRSLDDIVDDNKVEMLFLNTEDELAHELAHISDDFEHDSLNKKKYIKHSENPQKYIEQRTETYANIIMYINQYIRRKITELSENDYVINKLKKDPSIKDVVISSYIYKKDYIKEILSSYEGYLNTLKVDFTDDMKKKMINILYKKYDQVVDIILNKIMQ